MMSSFFSIVVDSWPSIHLNKDSLSNVSKKFEKNLFNGYPSKKPLSATFK